MRRLLPSLVLLLIGGCDIFGGEDEALTVETGARLYAAGDTVGFAVKNGLDQTVWLSNCGSGAPYMVERRTGQEWIPAYEYVPGCLGLYDPDELKPGEEHRGRFAASSAGTFRLIFWWGRTEERRTSSLYSSPFEVAPSAMVVAETDKDLYALDERVGIIVTNRTAAVQTLTGCTVIGFAVYRLVGTSWEFVKTGADDLACFEYFPIEAGGTYRTETTLRQPGLYVAVFDWGRTGYGVQVVTPPFEVR